MKILALAKHQVSLYYLDNGKLKGVLEMKRQLRAILNKYEQQVDLGEGCIDAICAPSYESLIIELMEFIEENKE